MAQAETALLEDIAREYQNPDSGRLIDQQFIGWTADRILPWIVGPDVLELGFGDDQWTSRILAASVSRTLLTPPAASSNRPRRNTARG